MGVLIDMIPGTEFYQGESEISLSSLEKGNINIPIDMPQFRAIPDDRAPLIKCDGVAENCLRRFHSWDQPPAEVQH